MRYAAEHKLNSEPLDRFVNDEGRINKCIARFSRGRRSGAIAGAALSRAGLEPARRGAADDLAFDLENGKMVAPLSRPAAARPTISLSISKMERWLRP
jgi:hypothetical protein